MGIALLFAAVLLWMVNDLRRDLKQSVQVVNTQLPEILENTRDSSQTLAVVSNDIRELRDLAGISTGTGDRSLVSYADGVLDAVESSGGVIGLKGKLGMSAKLDDPVPAAEWVVGARKEAVYLALRAQSQHELLHRLTTSFPLRRAWQMQIGEAAPEPLIDWLRVHHAESADVLEEVPDEEPPPP